MLKLVVPSPKASYLMLKKRKTSNQTNKNIGRDRLGRTRYELFFQYYNFKILQSYPITQENKI